MTRYIEMILFKLVAELIYILGKVASVFISFNDMNKYFDHV